MKIVFKAICKPITVISKTCYSKEGQKTGHVNIPASPQTTLDFAHGIPGTSFTCFIAYSNGQSQHLKIVGM